MRLDEALRAYPTLLDVAVTLLGLVVGSFLNVVGYRLPKMMQAEWECDCRELLKLEPAAAATPALNLSSPPSSCPACGGRIRPWHNIPVLGWLLLRGRCADCRAPISAQYPLVEAAAGLMALACAARFGWSAQLLPALAMSWALLVLTVIDVHEQLLPDVITWPLVWSGLGLSLWGGGVFVSPQASIAGGIAGFLVLWIVYQLYKMITGKIGMGFGDFKLLMALGAWFGWRAVPTILLLSSFVGAVIGVGLIVLRGRDRNVPISFGPFLAGAGWLVLIGGDSLPHLLSR